MLLIFGSAVVLVSEDTSEVPLDGYPYYPDLTALPPDDLYFSREVLGDGRPHLLLRFTTSVSNGGEGPLELVGNPTSSGQVVHQVIYDAPANGFLVEQRPLGIDLIHHPTHHHYHLSNFATYELYRLDQDGNPISTGQGGKQSSCVLDSVRMTSVPPQERAYTVCELERQGLSVGWQDTYSASLPDQWIDLGKAPLRGGTYVLRYVVDPLRQLSEGGRTQNNTAETRFTVRDGVILDRAEPPRCAIEGNANGIAGGDVTLICSYFQENTWVSVYWDEWDPWNTAANPAAGFLGQGPEDVAVTLEIPGDLEPGAFTISAAAFDSTERRHVAATVIYGVESGGQEHGGTVIGTPTSTTSWEPLGQ